MPNRSSNKQTNIINRIHFGSSSVNVRPVCWMKRSLGGANVVVGQGLPPDSDSPGAATIALEQDLDTGPDIGLARKRPRAEAAQAGAGVPGPRTYSHIYDFAKVLLQRLEVLTPNTYGSELREYTRSMNELKIVITTSYSGVGSAEWGAKFVQSGFQDVLGIRVETRFYSATDYSKICRNV